MKLHLLLFASIFTCSVPAYSQYFFTGEVRDVHGDRLQNVAVLVRSTGSLYKTGLEGNFEISSRNSEDSLLFAMPGYEPYRMAIRSADFVQITLKMRVPAPAKRGRLLSATSGAKVSFPADIDGMSYPMIRRFLDMGMPVPVEAVKVEELLNYFNLYYEEPADGALFHCASRLMSCPWNLSHRLLYVNTCARISDRQGTPPANLVYLIDASGSMDMPRKLPLIRSGFPLLIKNLRDNDNVSVVVFGGRVESRCKAYPVRKRDNCSRSSKG
ncbi:VWA domain-containing protein [Puia sp. P3]|uniref:VWA domain-containing protein n=1 Tax=Puia sp. P3 TaxID=3423952 RepID=UPI003D67667B